MHPISQAIKTIIDNTPGYSLNTLLEDLGINDERITEEFLTPKEICDILKISLWTFYNWKRKGAFVPYNFGRGFPKYKKSEVFAAFKKAK